MIFFIPVFVFTSSSFISAAQINLKVVVPSTELVTQKEKELVTYIGAKIKYQPGSGLANYNLKQTTRIAISKKAKNEEILNVLYPLLWTKDDIKSIDGHYLVLWYPEKSPQNMNYVGFSQPRCKSCTSETEANLSPILKSRSLPALKLKLNTTS